MTDGPRRPRPEPTIAGAGPRDRATSPARSRRRAPRRRRRPSAAPSPSRRRRSRADDAPARRRRRSDARADASPSRRRGRARSETEPRRTSRRREPRPTSAERRAPPTEPARARSDALIADALRAAGVRYAFTVPGESFLGLLDALGDAGIRVVATRHEGGGGVHGRGPRPADRPARRRLGTRAVGAVEPRHRHPHRAPGLDADVRASSARSSAPIRGREAFQEIDQVATIGGLAKWAARAARRPRTWPAAMGEAVRQALGGRPGPVLLSLPEDLLDEACPTTPARRPRRSARRAPEPTTRSARSSSCWPRRERPVILAGGGVLRARTSTELLRFAELLQVPVIAGWRRADVISNDHPLYLGMAGLGSPAVGPRPARGRRRDPRHRLPAERGDLVRTTRFPSAATRWIHVDIEPRRPAGLPPAELHRHGRRAGLPAGGQRAAARPGRARRRARRRPRQANNATDRAAWEAATVVDADAVGRPGRPPRAASSRPSGGVLPDDAILTTDAGNFAGWAGRGFRFRRPGTFLGPTSGAMGYGLPAAIAAALVHRDRPVVALVGDGGLAMTMAELETAVREHARVIVLVFDNERYGTIRMWQDRRGTRPGRRDRARARSTSRRSRGPCGARGVRVERDADVRAGAPPGARRGSADGHPARPRPALGLGRTSRPTAG